MSDIECLSEEEFPSTPPPAKKMKKTQESLANVFTQQPDDDKIKFNKEEWTQMANDLQETMNQGFALSRNWTKALETMITIMKKVYRETISTNGSHPGQEISITMLKRFVQDQLKSEFYTTLFPPLMNKQLTKWLTTCGTHNRTTALSSLHSTLKKKQTENTDTSTSSTIVPSGSHSADVPPSKPYNNDGDLSSNDDPMEAQLCALPTSLQKSLCTTYSRTLQR